MQNLPDPLASLDLVLSFIYVYFMEWMKSLHLGVL